MKVGDLVCHRNHKDRQGFIIHTITYSGGKIRCHRILWIDQKSVFVISTLFESIRGVERKL
jgi:hypothetical protein